MNRTLKKMNEFYRLPYAYLHAKRGPLEAELLMQ